MADEALDPSPRLTTSAPAVPNLGLSSFMGPGKPAAKPAPAATPVQAPASTVPVLKSENQDASVNALLGQFGQLSEQFSTPLPNLGRVQFSNPEAVDQFTSQKGFNPDGFNPADLAGNNARYAAREDWGSVLSKTLNDFSYKFAGSFKGNFETYGQVASALWNADLSKLELDQDEKLRRYTQDKVNEQVNHIFQTPEEDAHFFNKQFFKDIIGNSGFALGTFAAFGVELAGDSLLEAVTFGGATPLVAADAAGLGAKIVRGAQKLREGFQLADKTSDEIRAGARLASQFDEGLDLAKGVKQASKAASPAGERAMSSIWQQLSEFTTGEGRAEKLYQASRKVFENIPLVGTLPKYASRMVAAAESGEGVLKTVGIGLAGFRRSLVEFNMASSEASFEGVTTYGDTLSGLVESYRASHNGDAPSGSELARLREIAGKASSANYQSNLGILLLSNKLQFGNLLSKFTPANKLMRDLVEESEGSILRVSGKLLGKDTEKNLAEQFGQEGTRLYQKGALGSYGLYGKIQAEFGRKEAVWQLAKTFGKDALAFEVGEGLQENAQETTAAGWKNYYLSAYQGSPKTLYQAMGEGAKEQLTQQGAKTFLLGALTGSIIHGVTAPVGKGLEKIQDVSYGKNRSPVQKAKESAAKDVETLNAYFRDPGKLIFNPQQLLFNQQVQASAQMSAAAAAGRPYEWHNARQNSLLSIAAAARRLNSVDALTKQLAQAGEQFTPEQFQEAFGVDLKDTSFSSVQQFTTKLSEDLSQYVDELNHTRRRLGPVLDSSRLRQGSAQQAATNLYNHSVEQAVEAVALNKLNANLTAVRVQQVGAKLAQVEGLGQVSQWTLDSATTYDGQLAALAELSQDITRSKQEIKEQQQAQRDQANAGISYDASLHQELERQLAAKQELFQTMNQWLGYFQQAPATTSTTSGEPTSQTLPNFVGKNGELDHAEVRETFAKLLTQKVKLQNSLLPASRGSVQSSAKPALSEASLVEGFGYVLDYLRLGQDERDYREAVDKLANPQAFVAFHARVLEGVWKAGIALNLQALEESLPFLALKHAVNFPVEEGVPQAFFDAFVQSEKMQQLTQAINSDPVVQQLQALHLNPLITYEQAAYAQGLTSQLPDLVQKHLDEVFELQPAPTPVEAPVEATPVAGPVVADTTQPSVNPEHQKGLVRLNALLGARIMFGQESSDPEAPDQMQEDRDEIARNLLGITGLPDQESQNITNQTHFEIEQQAQQFENAGNLAGYAAWLNNAIEQQYQLLGQEAEPDVIPQPEPEPEAPTGLSIMDLLATGQLSMGENAETPAAPKPVTPSPAPTTLDLQSLLATGQLSMGEQASLPGAGEVPPAFEAEEGTVTDQQGTVVASNLEPAAATQLVDAQNRLLADLELSKQADLLGSKYTQDLGAQFVELAQQLYQAKTPRSGEAYQSSQDYYARGGKTALRKLAKELLRQQSAPAIEPVEVSLPTTTMAATQPALFVSQKFQGIAAITPQLFDSFRQELASIWAESSPAGRNFGEPATSSTESAPTEEEAHQLLLELLTCRL